MKNFTRLLNVIPFIFLLSVSSCNDDEDSPSYDYDFKDQNLAGTIDGLPFVLGEGRVVVVPYRGLFEDEEEEDYLSFNLSHVNEQQGDEGVCSSFEGNEVRVIGFIPAEIGIYEFSGADFFEAIVNLSNPVNPDDIVNNILAPRMGAVDILTITDSEVTGRMDVFIDDESSINGNFSAVVCLNHN